MPELFGVMPDGSPVYRVELETAVLRVAILTFGAAVQSIMVPDRSGRLANVVLGLTTLDDYITRSPHFGAVAGRYAGRIAGGRLTLDGVDYQLRQNNGSNALHGGPQGFGKRNWSLEDHSRTGATFALTSLDGDEGYPGRVDVKVHYALEGASLHIGYRAAATKTTVINLTNHSYFNLAGEGNGNILSHELQLASTHYLPIDADSIPTGENRPVAGSAFDFTVPRPIGARITDADPQLLRANGYDHTYMLEGCGLREVARLKHPESGRALTVSTTEPALQVYTANSLTGSLIGPSGRPYRQWDAVCLEAQHVPNSPNQPAFPSTALDPGAPYAAMTIFCFEPIEC